MTRAELTDTIALIDRQLADETVEREIPIRSTHLMSPGQWLRVLESFRAGAADELAYLDRVEEVKLESARSVTNWQKCSIG